MAPLSIRVINAPDYNLDTAGNLQLVKVPRRTIQPYGHMHENDITLKLYFLEEEKELPPDYFSSLSQTVVREMMKEMQPRSRLGFGILSEEVINLNQWDTAYDVPIPLIYAFDEKCGRKGWFRQDVENVGSYCAGERLVLQFESEHWNNYINSSHDKDQKRKYINEFLSTTSI